VTLIDTSIWISWARRDLPIPSQDDFEEFATTGPVVQEFIQGLPTRYNGQSSPERDLQFVMMSLRRLSDPVPLDLYLEAAEIYRLGRRKGITIRSSNDCLIAAIAIKNRVPVWHADRDFDSIARFTALEVRTG